LRLAADVFLRALLLASGLREVAAFLAAFDLPTARRDGRLVFLVAAVLALPVFVAISLISLALQCFNQQRPYGQVQGQCMDKKKAAFDFTRHFLTNSANEKFVGH
jgi:hypothetical protein